MADRISPADLEKVQAIIDADPRVQAIVRDMSLDGRTKMLRLAALTKSLPDSYMIDTAGKVRFNDGVDWMKWAIPAATLGTLGVGGVLAGGGAAAASAGAPAATEAGIFGSAGLGSTIAPVASATSGGSIWARLAPQLVGAGIQGLGSYMQSRAANKAAQQQMQASERALDFSKGIYNDQKANQQPFIQTGQSAIGTLGGLMGYAPPQAPQGNTAQPRGPLSSLGGEMVQMRAPDGSVRMVPANQASYLEARGAQRI